MKSPPHGGCRLPRRPYHTDGRILLLASQFRPINVTVTRDTRSFSTFPAFFHRDRGWIPGSLRDLSVPPPPPPSPVPFSFRCILRYRGEWTGVPPTADATRRKQVYSHSRRTALLHILISRQVKFGICPARDESAGRRLAGRLVTCTRDSDNYAHASVPTIAGAMLFIRECSAPVSLAVALSIHICDPQIFPSVLCELARARARYS